MRIHHIHHHIRHLTKRALHTTRLAVSQKQFILFALIIMALPFASLPLIRMITGNPMQFRRSPLTNRFTAVQKGTGITATLSADKQAVTMGISRNQVTASFAMALSGARTTQDTAGVSYHAQNGMSVRYQTIPEGIKEDIILTKPPGRSVILSSLSVNNAQPLLTSDGQIVFVNDKGEYQFHIRQPYAVDASGSVTRNIRYRLADYADVYQTIKKDIHQHISVDKQLFGPIKKPNIPNLANTYMLVLDMDSTWINDPSRSYPITIDPTVVHDTSAEFATGQLNRIKDSGSGASPVLETDYEELPADEHTVGLWHMNEASGNILDSSGNSRTGTPTGTTVVAGKLGNARNFTGADDISLGSQTMVDNLSEVTVEAWVYPTAQTAATHFRVFSENAVLYVGQYANQITFYMGNGTTWSLSEAAGGTLPINQWSHVGWVKNDTSYYIYLNGILIKSGTTAPATLGTSANVNYFSTSDGTTQPWTGSIDEVRISNIARTAEEIKLSASRRPYAAYTSDIIDLTGGTAQLAAWNSLSWAESGVTTGDGETLKDATSLISRWNFNEASGTTADNAEGTAARDLTLTGFDSTTSQDADPDSSWTANNRRWGAGALQFDGIDSYASCTDANCGGTTALDIGLRNWSISSWIKTTKSTRQIIAGKGAATTQYSYSLETGLDNTGEPDFNFYNTVDGAYMRANGTTAVNDGTWHYLVGTYDGTTISLYIDGKLDASSTTKTGTLVSDSTSNFEIGARNATTLLFQGTIDATAVFARALTASEILSNYNAANIEFQTRVGNDSTPDDGSWEAWRPVTSETSIDTMDTSSDQWIVDTNQNSSSTINKIGIINTGTGNDGACVIDNGTKTLDTTAGSSVCNGSARSTAYAVNFSDTTLEGAGETSVTVSSTPTGLAAGDEFIIINLRGTSTNYGSVGEYETHVISSVSTNTLNFTDYPLKNTYDGTTQKIMVQRVPNFGAVTVCGGNTGGGCTAAATVTASAWNGTKNGLLFFRSNGTTTINSGGIIDANALGFAGGISANPAFQGQSISSTGTNVRLSNIGGGGGGIVSASNVGGGGGGSYGTYGTSGFHNGTQGGYNAGLFGNAYGNNTSPQLLFLGSGGGGGSYNTGANGYGGAGGGIIHIAAATLTNNGTVRANGSNGVNGFGPESGAAGGGGGGSGGTISLLTNTGTLGSSTITSTGGTGGTGTYGGGSQGGNGGTGRISINYSVSLSGTTSPAAYTQKLQTSILAEGTGAQQFQTGRSEVDSATVGLWHLDETGGTGAYLKDATANANNGTPTGTTLVNGVSGKARNFDGSNDVIDLGSGASFDFGNNGKFTHSGWVKPTTIVNYAAFVSKVVAGRGGTYSYMTVFMTDGRLSAYTGAAWVDICPAGSIIAGKWQHAAFTYNGTIATGYVNGSECGSAAFTYTDNAAHNLYIGSWYSVATTYDYNGLIDDVQTSNVARTPEEIAELYRAGRDHYVTKTFTATDLSGKSALPFFVASDRPGTYMSATIGESAYVNYQPDANTAALWHLDENQPSVPTNFDYDTFEAGPGSTDDWTSRNTVDPDITDTTAYTGRYSLHMPVGWGRNFESGTGEPTGVPYDTNTYPYMCMAYKIPSATVNNMLILLDGTWRSITMTQGEAPTSYPKVATWNPLITDNTWQYKCINLDAQIDALVGTGAHTIAAVIWHDGGGLGAITGEFWIDDFMISAQPFNPAQFSAKDATGNNNDLSVPTGIIAATGGTVTNANGYTIHTFTGSGTFQVTSGAGNVEALVVAGGGGGANTGSGGGAGGYVYNNALPVTATSYSVTVGQGGSGGLTTAAPGVIGGNSVFSTITAGGGGVGVSHGGCAGGNGGSGGGGPISTTCTATGGTASAGNAGGAGFLDAGWVGTSGGGGGAGAVGTAGGNAAGVGKGGNGLQNTISGTSQYYAGGGGGSEVNGTFVGAGGAGGGGSAVLNAAGGSGTANTGGGGAGGAYNAGVYTNGGSGGSGIVIVRYPTVTTSSKSNAIGTFSVQGKIGHGRNFNGTSDHIFVPDSDNLDLTTAGTIDLWFKRSATQNYQMLVTKGNPANPLGYQLMDKGTTNQLVLRWAQDSDTITSNAVVPNNVWTHVAGVYNGSTVAIYINGVLDNSVAYSTNASANTLPLFIGKRSDGYYYSGQIDEVRISNVARSADEIRQTYEAGLRTHPVTIDFGAKLDSGNLITGNGDPSFTVDATFYGLQNKGDMLYPGEKAIVHENYDGTEYLAQGTVTAVTASTGAVTVAAWDTGSTFPAGGYTANADVFKWQREYWNITEPLDSHMNTAANIALRITDGNEGRTVWLDDLRSTGDYLTTPGGSTITSSTGNRYFQYRMIAHSWDEEVSASLTSATLDYHTSIAPLAPTSPLTEGLTNPTDVGTVTPKFSAIHSDPDSDNAGYYEIEVNNKSDFTGTVLWDTGQTALTPFASGARSPDITYAGTALALNGYTYYWRIRFTDIYTDTGPWSATSTFVMTNLPIIPTLDSPANNATNQSLTPKLKTTTHDNDGDYLRYKIQLCTDLAMTTGCQTFDQTASQTGWSGQNTQTNTAYTSGTQAVYTVQSPLLPATPYYWRSYAIDPAGTNTWNATQATPFSFTTGSSSPTFQMEGIQMQGINFN